MTVYSLLIRVFLALIVSAAIFFVQTAATQDARQSFDTSVDQYISDLEYRLAVLDAVFGKLDGLAESKRDEPIDALNLFAGTHPESRGITGAGVVTILPSETAMEGNRVADQASQIVWPRDFGGASVERVLIDNSKQILESLGPNSEVWPRTVLLDTGRDASEEGTAILLLNRPLRTPLPETYSYITLNLNDFFRSAADIESDPFRFGAFLGNGYASDLQLFPGIGSGLTASAPLDSRFSTRKQFDLGDQALWLNFWSPSLTLLQKVDVVTWATLAVGAILVLFAPASISAVIASSRSAGPASRPGSRSDVELDNGAFDLLQSVGIGALFVGPNGHIMKCNRTAAHTLARLRDDVVGLKLEAVLPNFCFHTPMFRLQYSPPVKDSHDLTLDLKSVPMTTSNGVSGQVITIQNVTASLAAAHELRQSEARWAMAMQSAGIGVFDVDLKTGRSTVSESWCELTGLRDAPSDFDYQSYFMSRIHSSDLPGLRAADEACLRGDAERSVSEFRYETERNGTRWMRSKAVVTERADDGTPLRLIGTQTDITEKVESRAAFEAIEDRFRLTFSFAPVGMLILDRNLMITEANNLMYKLTGHSRSELMGEIGLNGLFSVDQLVEIQSKLDALCLDAEQLMRTEVEVLNRDGNSAWCVLNATITKHPTSGEITYILQFHDISEEKKTAQLKNEFIATVSHELRAPLTSIKAALDIMSLKLAQKLEKPELRLLEIAKSNSDRLALLVNDVLDFEKIQAVGIALNSKQESLHEIIGLAREQILPVASQKNLTILIEELSHDVIINVDCARLVQVIANLISNACKFSPEGGTIRVIFAVENEMANIAVVDRGPGVPDGFVDRLFSPFSQADGSDTREKGGTGLGLSIAKEIISRMGGEIGYSRHADVATVFWLRLPLGRSASDSAEHQVKVKGATPHRNLTLVSNISST